MVPDDVDEPRGRSTPAPTPAPTACGRSSPRLRRLVARRGAPVGRHRPRTRPRSHDRRDDAPRPLLVDAALHHEPAAAARDARPHGVCRWPSPPSPSSGSAPARRQAGPSRSRGAPRRPVRHRLHRRAVGRRGATVRRHLRRRRPRAATSRRHRRRLQPRRLRPRPLRRLRPARAACSCHRAAGGPRRQLAVGAHRGAARPRPLPHASPARPAGSWASCSVSPSRRSGCGPPAASSSGSSRLPRVGARRCHHRARLRHGAAPPRRRPAGHLREVAAAGQDVFVQALLAHRPGPLVLAVLIGLAGSLLLPRLRPGGDRPPSTRHAPSGSAPPSSLQPDHAAAGPGRWGPPPGIPTTRQRDETDAQARDVPWAHVWHPTAPDAPARPWLPCSAACSCWGSAPAAPSSSRRPPPRTPPGPSPPASPRPTSRG